MNWLPHLQIAASALPVECDESYQKKLAHVPLDFNDGRAAFISKSSLDIVRSWAVLSACQIQPLVQVSFRGNLRSSPLCR